MPNYIRDLNVRNVVLSDDAIQELNGVLTQRVNAHNSNDQDAERKLTCIYVVRFDGRGYRTFSAEEAWRYYKGATRLERLILSASSPMGLKTNQMFGENIEVRLDADNASNSILVVGGDSRDWVETTFSELEAVLSKYKNLPTAVVRTQWTDLLLQLLGVGIGVLVCLWLAGVSAPFLQNVEYPRALAFGFWFLVYSNLWSYMQKQAIAGIAQLFPNVRFSRKGEHWAINLFRKGVEVTGIALALWVFGWLSKWAVSVVTPFLAVSL